ncbi:hypothetical protein SPTER_17810 [Sporomusa termitida]|uniref:Tripartite tricarboxylate transporter family receptor n=1 Tax=Sporomusa termitida TaxID=2377 RepID=A0A517DSW9_9FIRM|nr:hypothetical protein SPTER_17810 [Sporomusa termitida]
MRKRVLVLLAVAFLLVSIMVGGCGEVEQAAMPVSHEKYPERPVSMIVPFSPGGGLDLTIRSLEKLCFQPFRSAFSHS